MWDMLLVLEKEVKQLASSILVTNTSRLKTDYLGTRQTKVTLQDVPMDINEDHV